MSVAGVLEYNINIVSCQDPKAAIDSQLFPLASLQEVNKMDNDGSLLLVYWWSGEA